MGGIEKFRTYGDVFDERTLRNIFKLKSEGYFEDLASPISTGKESNVFSAKTKSGDYVCVKIYMINTANFRRMYNYIGSDKRFEGLQKKRRQIIYAWAQREYRNLMIAYESKINVPKPIVVKENILVMEFIGNNGEAAKLLKYSHPKNMKKFSKEIVNNIKKLYKARLVHGDLSEFNIINCNERPIFIDFSHGIKLDYQNADELLKRDINNIKKFFVKNNVKIKDKFLDKFNN